MKTINTVSTKDITVQTHTWERFGNNIFSAIVALCEFIHNAYAACMHLTDNHVDVSIVPNGSDTYLYVKNNGHTADLQRVLDYGRINHGTVLNQWGTGFKTAASFFNPTNDGWAFYTRDEEHIYRVCAPFDTKMTIEELDVWPFEDWVVSCVEVKVSEKIDMSCITADEIGYRYAYAIHNGFYLTFNKKSVREIAPRGRSLLDENKVLKINGEDVEFEYSIHSVTERDSNRGYFTNSQEDQGVYIYVNNCFAEKVGVSIIKKKQRGGGFLKAHPSINGMICTLNIKVPNNHKADIPFVNAKCNINWKSDIGKQFVDAINDCIGEHFYNKWHAGMEKEKREYLDIVCTELSRKSLFYYSTEVGIGNGLRADAILYKERGSNNKPILASVDTIIEFKSGNITAADVGQAFGYLANLDYCHPSTVGTRRILLVGKGLTKDAQCVIRAHENDGHEISFLPYAITPDELNAYREYKKSKMTTV